MEENEEETEKSSGCLILTILIILIAISTTLLVVALLKKDNNSGITLNTENTDGAKKLFERSATISDITITQSSSLSDMLLSLSGIYIVKPNKDIKGLKIRFDFLDDSHNVITTVNKTIGDTKAEAEYSVKLELSNFTFSQLRKIEYVSYTVTGGTVSYFA